MRRSTCCRQHDEPAAGIELPDDVSYADIVSGEVLLTDAHKLLLTGGES